ncbi:hypothetical protein ABPG74_006984 [Tetrahymena malaccensis]
MAVEVYLNVYDITKMNSFIGCLGLGLYHTGIQINNVEYRFGAHDDYYSGVCTNTPKDGMGIYRFNRSIFLGMCDLTSEQIEEIISDLEIDYIGRSYDIFKKNCNHFSDDLCKKLLGKQIPRFVFSVSNFLSFTRCIVSKKIIKGGFDTSDRQEKDSLFLGKKRIECKKTRDVEMSLMQSQYSL